MDKQGISALAIALACAVIALAAALSGGAGSTARAEEALTLPPIRHVFVVNLENFSYRDSFDISQSPYIAAMLRDQGLLVENYYGIGHNSLDNYIAQISGQAPNPSTQADCPQGHAEFTPGDQFDQNGQVVGQGCVYPAGVETLPDQLEAHNFNWKGYMGDLGDRPTRDGGYSCGHPAVTDPPQERTGNTDNPDKYATKHNPFAYFHSLIDDDASCKAHVAPLSELVKDLQQVDTTPNFSLITPDMCDDGHDKGCFHGYAFDGTDGTDHGTASDAARLGVANRFMEWLAPQILASPAYRQDGMLIVTFDESFTAVGVSVTPEDTAACCNEIPGPNSASPGIAGPGGGKTGAVILSPYIRPGSSTATGTSGVAPDAYNHYSLLRSMEDLFGIDSGGTDGHGHLGFAAAAGVYDGPGAFGQDVYNWVPGVGAIPGEVGGPVPGDVTPGHQPTGPRPLDATTEWQAPQPQSNDLHGIACPADTQCVAVGDAGTILLGDGSGRWTLSPVGTARDLNGIACPSPERCVAVGERGVGLFTTDAGQTWRASELGGDQTLRGIACPSTEICFAVGDDGSIERSGDGGAAWSSLANSGTAERLARIACPTETTCTASGGERNPVEVKTTDGGETWTSRTFSNPGAINDDGTGIACTDATHCAVSAPNSTVRWTTDGSNWNSLKWNGPGTTQVENRFLGIACPSGTTCFMAADRGGVFKFVTSPAAVTRLTPANRGDDMRDIACPSVTHCVAVGDQGQILATSDGQAWTSQRAGLVPRKPGDDIGATISTLRAAACMSSGACVAVGDGGSVAFKHGPGTGWAPASSGVPPKQLTANLTLDPDMRNLYGVDCTDAGMCLAVGSFDTILRSGDGGDTWSAVPTPAANPLFGELRGVSCATDSNCVAVGAYGRVLTSRNGGTAWTELSPPTPFPLNGVSCAGSTCVAVGSVGTIVRSDDSGATWSRAGSGTPAYLGGVSCPTDLDCLTVGQNGTVLVSLDGGLTWNPSATGVDDDLAAVDCELVTQCTATGSSGTVLRSADFGLTWSVVGTGTHRALGGVGCAGNVVCYPVGESASVLEVADRLPVDAPELRVGDIEVNEGNAGLGFAPLTVKLSRPVGSGDEVRVSYSTLPLDGVGAASPGVDYEPVGGRLRFFPGESEKTILVPIAGDTEHEPDETFEVVLSRPDGALVADGRATVTILDDDPAPEPAPSDQAGPTGPELGAGDPTGLLPRDQGLGDAPSETKTPPPPCRIPRLTGRRLVSALRLLARTQCAIGRLVERRSRKRAGTVIGQRPRPGALKPSGARINLVVSRKRSKR